MRTFHLLVLLTAGTLAAPVAAQSYDGVPLDSRGNPASLVSGLRVEPRIGYERVIAEFNTETATDSTSVREAKSGVTYGGEVGYDAQVGSDTVLGVYAGIEGSSAKTCASDLFFPANGDRTCLATDRNLTVGARGGYLLSQTTFLYIKGGFSRGRLELRNTNAAVPANNFSEKDSLSGFHAGAGLQTSFSPRFYGKVEYVYTDYNGYETFDGVTKTSLDFSRHQVNAGFGVRF